MTPPRGAAPSAAPRAVRSFFDPLFHWFTAVCAAIIVVLVAATVYLLFVDSKSTIAQYGLSFVTSTVWNPNRGQYGILTAIYGTVVTTAIALVIAVPLALVIALLLVELVHPSMGRVVGTMVEMLAAIPSIIFGMWGLFVLAPFVATHVEPWLGSHLGFLPIFDNGGGGYTGLNVFTAGVILALMILPFITAVSRDVLEMVPTVLKEAGYGAGSTTWEVTRKISLRYGSSGIVGAIILGLGRALGETMAVTFVIGSSFVFSWSLFNPGYTIASLIATKFNEASDVNERAVLIEAGLVLLLMELVIQIVAQGWLKRMRAKTGARA